MKLIENFDDKRKAGYEMRIDKIRFHKDCRSGVMVRVIDEWASPKWFDLSWFVKSNSSAKFLKEEL